MTVGSMDHKPDWHGVRISRVWIKLYKYLKIHFSITKNAQKDIGKNREKRVSSFNLLKKNLVHVSLLMTSKRSLWKWHSVAMVSYYNHEFCETLSETQTRCKWLLERIILYNCCTITNISLGHIYASVMCKLKTKRLHIVHLSINNCKFK